MATTTSEQDQSVEVVIPAAYLEDVRTALGALIEFDSDHDYPENLVEDNDISDQLLGATADTTVTGGLGVVYYMLHDMIESLVERVRDLARTEGPDAAAIPGLCDRVGWATRESLRINPLGR